MAKVSVIIPVYRVENFIGKCLDSLVSQTMDDVEYIFVDDASPDRSMEIVAQRMSENPVFASRSRILHHDVNKGLPAARNTGLAVASGEYVLHCDSDDYLEPEMIREMYSAAVEQSADIVWCDWFLTFSRDSRYMKEPDFTSADKALSCMLGGGMKYNVWNKLVRRRLYTDNGISFPDGHGMGEDMTMMMLFACASKVFHLRKALYHYVKMNVNAMGNSAGPERLAALDYNVRRTADFLKKYFGSRYDREIAFLKLQTKFPLLIMTDDWGNFRKWRSLYHDTDRYIMKNPYVSFRIRCVQWCASHGLFVLVSIHYILVCRLFYGVVYR